MDASHLSQLAVDVIAQALQKRPPPGVSRAEVRRFLREHRAALLRSWDRALRPLVRRVRAATHRTAEGKRSVIHINQFRVGKEDAAVTVKTGKLNRYARDVEVLDPGGRRVLRVCSRREPPPGGGPRCWIETDGPLVIARDGPRVVTRGPARVLVSRALIRKNGRAAGPPVIRVQQGGRFWDAHQVQVLGAGGEVAGEVVYRPDRPLSCGAKCWVETRGALRLVGERAPPGRR